MPSPTHTLSIGQVAKAAEVGVETIRFYEREGLLTEPPRRQSGYRQYPSEAVSRVRFIRRARQLGFTLKEIRELLDLRIDPERSCAEVRALARAGIQDVKAKIADLQQIRAALENLAGACRGRGLDTECPILDAIAKERPDFRR